MSESEPTGAKQVCTFLLDGLLFGVDVACVQEVIRQQDMTPVPLAPPVVGGLINLRGRIVTALDMRTRLKLPPRGPDQPAVNVVVRHDEGVISLLVDEIGDVVDVDDATAEEPPETLPASTKALINSVYKLEPQLLLLLDAKLATHVNSQLSEKRNNNVD